MLCSAQSKRIPDINTKLHFLNEELQNSTISVGPAVSTISSSPYACSRKLHERIQVLGLARKLMHALPREVNSIVYNTFFDDIYTIGAATLRLENVHRTRWCTPRVLSIPRPAALAAKAAKNLRWLAKRVPPRVHIANTRLHLNGWHTGRRYQRRNESCKFCKNIQAEDSIEHLLFCPAVHDLFPVRMKIGNPARVPVAHFFMFQPDGKHKMVFALMVYAIYAVHNEFRHSNDHRQFKLCVYRMLGDINVRLEIKRAF